MAAHLSRITMALCLAGCASPELPKASAPAAARPRPVNRSASTAPVAETSAPAPKCDALSARAAAKPQDPIASPIPFIELPKNLEPLFEKWAALERKSRTEPVRIAFYGDSNLTLDGISGALRRDLQGRFGDAGHGFLGLGMPFRGYRHMDVSRTHVGYWRTYIFTHGEKPKVGGFGAAGMAAATGEKRARVRITTAKEGSPVGTRASRFGVFFLRQPGGGRFALEVDGEPKREVDTEAASESVALEWAETEDAPHTFVVENLEKRFVHFYGTVLERKMPGTIVDSLGVTGSTYGALAQLDETRVREMLALRPYDMVIFMLGTNFWNTEENPEGLKKLVALHQSVTPGVPILVLMPPDHVKTKSSTHSDPRILRVVEQLAEAARQAKVAQWDLRQAMGGDGSMWTFRQRGLAGDDMYHLTDTGARIMGHRLGYALLNAYQSYVQAHPQSGCR